MKETLKRLDTDEALRKKILPYCRLKEGEIWEDDVFGHKVGVLSAEKREDVLKITGNARANLSLQDPPYNFLLSGKKSRALGKEGLHEYMAFSKAWVENASETLSENSSFYVWLGADQTDEFVPFADFIVMMREFPDLQSRSFITLRNQRGYGTQKNWMSTRQELLYYTKGTPEFNVIYTDIPKVLKGYYKDVGGSRKENIARSRSENIRASNVWIDVQQVFYRMEENVSGCYAQKPIKAIERIIKASSKEGDLVFDFFAHAGTTLLACEMNKRKCFTFDKDPIFAEITIRRLEFFRKQGKKGFQASSPFPEIE